MPVGNGCMQSIFKDRSLCVNSTQTLGNCNNRNASSNHPFGRELFRNSQNDNNSIPFCFPFLTNRPKEMKQSYGGQKLQEIIVKKKVIIVAQNKLQTEPQATDYIKMWTDHSTKKYLNEVKGENYRKDTWIGSLQKGDDRQDALLCHFSPHLLRVHGLRKSGFYNDQ